jgi:lysophospholipase L1-like esterase
LSLAVLFLSLAVPELLLRAFWTPPEPGSGIVGARRFVDWLVGLSLEGESAGTLYREDRDRLWRLASEVAIETRNYHAADTERAPAIQITINEAGYRGPAAGAPGTARRVVCLGDSNFFGYPLDDAHTFPAALDRALRNRGQGASYEVLNAGTPGYSVVQGLRWFRGTFEPLRPDVVLLSYLNNDAWRQPSTDSEQMRRNAGIGGWLRRLGGRSVLVEALASLAPAPPAEDLVERVPLPEFRATYRALLEAARTTAQQVLILDYRTEDAYQPYSAALRELSRELGAEYVSVLDRIVAAQERNAASAHHLPLLRQVRARWGAETLRDNPHLTYYAEIQPEHLNEVGVAVLAGEVADRIVAAPWR